MQTKMAAVYVSGSQPSTFGLSQTFGNGMTFGFSSPNCIWIPTVLRKDFQSEPSNLKQTKMSTFVFPVSKLVCRRYRPKLTSLPDEILLKILSFVPTYDLVQNVARVSKHFHRLTRDADAHVAITFTNHVNTDKVVAFLKNKRKVCNDEQKIILVKVNYWLLL